MRKNARLIIAVFGVVFAVFVALQFKRRGPVGPATTIAAPASGAVVETTGGQTQRFDSSREHVRVKYDKLLTYSNGSSKLVGVMVTMEDRSGNGRSFVITGREGSVEPGETDIVLDGDVRLQSSDGLTARTEHATYTSSDGNVSAPGPVDVSKGRMSASGKGLKYDKGRDVLIILAEAIVKVAPDGSAANAGEGGDGKSGGVDVSSGTAAFARRDKLIQFDQRVRIVRSGQTIESDAAIARLSQDEQRIETLELHNHARISGTTGGAGSLRAMSGADMTLNYAADGQSLQRALIVGEASIQLAGEGTGPGRQIVAQTLDITLGPDGVTPIGLQGREAVQLTFPPEPGAPARTIRSSQIDARGEPGRGITRATFTGGVQFREHGDQVERAANSAQLEIAMKPGMASIDEARFLHAVRFEQGQLSAFAAAATYDTVKGNLELTGSEPGQLTPRTINERIAVDATRIDVVLDGPQLKAAGSVKSTLQPAKAGADAGDAKLPSMLKQDQPVTVVADNLAYDGPASLATYTGNAKLFQVDTTIKGDSMIIDEKQGDLSASGHTMTSTLRDQEDKDKKKVRSQSTGTSNDLKYEDGPRRLTYTGAAHLVGPEGDMSAQKIELYLKLGGDDVERAEGYAAPNEKLTLREVHRTTTGARMTYTADKETYVVTGAPATLIDECGRETIGKTLTFVKSADTIVADGNQQIRTQTKGGSGKCP